MNKKIALVTILLMTAVPAALFAWGGDCFYGWHGGPHMGYFWGGGFFMWIVTIILLALLVFFGVKLYKTKNTEPGVKGSPLDIVKERYARGEITKEQYEALKKDLV